MGAWGEGPFDSDGGHDWLDIDIHQPIANKIKLAFENFLRQKVRKIPLRVVDPAKKKGYAVFMARGRRKGRLRGFVPYPSRDRGLEKWRKQWSSFYTTVTMPGRRWMHDVTEAAAGLLNELTPYKNVYERLTKRKLRGMIGVRIHRGVKKTETGARRAHASLPVNVAIHYEAETMRLYSLAAKCLREILADEAYLSSWRSPAMKKKALETLAESLEVKVESERAEKAYRAAFKGWAVRKKRRSS